jgi:hypothetical protein
MSVRIDMLNVTKKHVERFMSDEKPVLKQVEDKIRDAAKAVEDFADKVAAPEEPVVLIPENGAPPPEPSAGSKKDSQDK